MNGFTFRLYMTRIDQQEQETQLPPRAVFKLGQFICGSRRGILLA